MTDEVPNPQRVGVDPIARLEGVAADARVGAAQARQQGDHQAVVRYLDAEQRALVALARILREAEPPAAPPPSSKLSDDLKARRAARRAHVDAG